MHVNPYWTILIHAYYFVLSGSFNLVSLILAFKILLGKDIPFSICSYNYTKPASYYVKDTNAIAPCRI